jgi:hypothetical protein
MNDTDIISPPMDEREVLRQSIESDKAELLDAVGDLKTAVQHQVSVTEWIANRPFAWLAGAFLVGVWLSHRRA